MLIQRPSASLPRLLVCEYLQWKDESEETLLSSKAPSGEKGRPCSGYLRGLNASLGYTYGAVRSSKEVDGRSNFKRHCGLYSSLPYHYSTNLCGVAIRAELARAEHEGWLGDVKRPSWSCGEQGWDGRPCDRPSSGR